MKFADLLELLLLGAVWGSSFLFMRWSAPEFGTLTLAWLRVTGGALFLLPILLWRQGREPLAQMRQCGWPLAVIGLLNSAAPFALFAYALQHLPAGIASILNATVPMWTALVAWAWIAQSPTAFRLMGLLLGVAGVTLLITAKGAVPSGEVHLLGALACLLATLNYAFAAIGTKKWLGALSPLAVATGSQLAAAAWLLVPGLLALPAAMPGARSWAALAALAVLCTGVAYILYFRLFARVGPTKAVTVTFLIPLFAVLWGALFLGEPLTLGMLGGGALVLAGTALSLGLWPKETLNKSS
jgi:drug/metabolite transporter (DMT)-like permease